MARTHVIGRTMALALALSAIFFPLAANASLLSGTYSVSYGPGTNMCPSPYDNTYACPSGVGGIFGVGGLIDFNQPQSSYYYGSNSVPPYYDQPSYYSAYQYQQPYYQQPYNYAPSYSAANSYYYVPQQQSYTYAQPYYGYGYPAYQYAASAAPTYYSY